MTRTLDSGWKTCGAWAAGLALFGLAPPASQALPGGWDVLPHAEECRDYSGANASRSQSIAHLTRLLAAQEPINQEHIDASLALAQAWRRETDLRIAIEGAKDDIQRIAGGAGQLRNSSASPPPAQAAALAAAHQALTARWVLLGARDAAEAKFDPSYMRDLVTRESAEYRAIVAEIDRARRALQEAERIHGPTGKLQADVVAAQVALDAARLPSTSPADLERLGRAHAALINAQMALPAVIKHRDALREQVRQTWLVMRYMEALAPRLRGCIAQLGGPGDAPTGPPADPPPGPPAGPPTARDPADRTGPIGVVQVAPTMVEFYFSRGAPTFSGSLGMTLAFDPNGGVSGTVQGGAVVRGRWGGGVAEGEITGLPRGRTARWKFTNLRLEKVGPTWTLKSDGLWCAEETGLDDSDRAGGQYRFWGYIQAPGAAPNQTPPMEGLKLCDRP